MSSTDTKTSQADGERPSEHTLAAWLLALAALPLLSATGCEPPPPTQQLETAVDFRIGGESTRSSSAERLVDDIESADDEVYAAISPDVLTSDVVDALIDAEERNLDVRLVMDSEHELGNSSVESLQEADIPITFGDGTIYYLPDPNLSQVLQACDAESEEGVVICSQGDPAETPGCPGNATNDAMCRPDDFNLMSHRFFLIDDEVAWNFGSDLEEFRGSTLAWRSESEYLIEDFGREFRQLSGGSEGRDKDGVFATTLDTYNGPLKSTTDDRVDYYTDKGVVEIRFNPQERLMKHVIDTVYDARSSVWIASPSIRNPFLLDALAYKIDRGFEVRIVVGNQTQPSGDARTRLENLGATFVEGGGGLPSFVLTDQASDGREWPRTGLVLSHPMWRAQPFDVIRPEGDGEDVADRVRVYPSDHFVDGNMWKIRESAGHLNTERIAPLDRMATVFANLTGSQ